jgi:hypothetical protein
LDELVSEGFLPPDTDRTFRRIGNVESFALLFPRATSRANRSRAGIVLRFIAGFAALAIITLLRQSGTPAWNTVWAEDGRYFYQPALQLPLWKDLTSLYAGYVQLLPRLLGEFATLFPVKDLAPIMAISGCVGLSAVALIVFHASRGHIKSPYARLVLVMAIALLPIATRELLNNAVNLPWWLFLATFWVLLWRPTSWVGGMVAALVCFLAVSSDPVVGVLLPIALLRLYTLRPISEQAATAGFFVGLVYQTAATYFGHGGVVNQGSTFGGVPQAFLLRVGLGWLVGGRLTSDFISSAPVIGMVLGGLLFVGLAFMAAWRSDMQVRLFAAVTMAWSVVIFVVPAWLRGVAPALAHETATSNGRFAETPILLLVSVLLVRFELLPSARNTAGASSIMLSLALVGELWLSDFRPLNGRSDGPAWSVQVALATEKCDGPIGAYVESVGLPPDSGNVTLQASPGFPEWTLMVPCRDLEGSLPH